MSRSQVGAWSEVQRAVNRALWTVEATKARRAQLRDAMDEDLLIFLGEAALELRLPDADQAPDVVAKAMLAVGQLSVGQILAWDLGRLKNEAGLVVRADKGRTMIGSGWLAPAAVDLVGLVLDRVARTCKEAPAPAGKVAGGGGDASEEVAERKKANELYEDFGLVTGIRLELGFRDSHVTTYHRNYKEHLPTRGVHLLLRRVHSRSEKEARAAFVPRICGLGYSRP
eukprot:scaffold1172_cov124-Isochrysis_galbana.AAC.5